MRVIDTWVNVDIGGEGRPEFLRRVAKDYFKRDDEDFFRSYGADEMLALMDRLEVEKAILTTAAHRPDPTVLQCAKSHPDRFALGAQLDPTQPMKAVRALDLRPGVAEKFLYDNAQRVFFGGQGSDPVAVVDPARI